MWCHAAGVKFMAHSCGAIRPLIPDLIALGVDVLDPIQVAAEGMEPAALKRDFGEPARLSWRDLHAADIAVRHAAGGDASAVLQPGRHARSRRRIHPRRQPRH